MFSICDDGAHSMARSAWFGKSLSGTTGQSIFCCVEPGAGFLLVAGGDAGELQPGNAVGEPARQHAADGAEAGDGDAGVSHEPSAGASDPAGAARALDHRSL